MSGRNRGRSRAGSGASGAGGAGGRGAGGRGAGGRGAGGHGAGGHGASNLPFRPHGGGGGGRGGPQAEVFKQEGVSPTINKDVTAQEDKIVSQSGKLIIQNAKNLSPTMPARPAYGTRGRSIVVWANYFNLAAKDGLVMLRYSINIFEDGARANEPKGRLAKRIVTQFIDECLAEHRKKVATDFRSNIISKVELISNGDRREYVIRYRDEKEDAPAENAKSYRIQLEKVRSVSASQIIEYLTSLDANSRLESIQEAISYLNIVAGHYPKLTEKITSIGANKHFMASPDPSEQQDLGAGLVAIRGFFLSVRAATNRLLVNVQVKNAAFYKPLPLPSLMSEHKGSFAPGSYSIGKTDRFLRKLRVYAMHTKKNNKAGQPVIRIKQIAGLASTEDGNDQPHPPRVPTLGAGASTVQFWLEPSGGSTGSRSGAGRYITVQQFFREQYRIELKNANMPVVNVGSRSRPIYLPAEVCEVVRGQAAAAKLSPDQTSSMIRFAVRKPHQNAASIIHTGNALLQFQNPKNETLTSFGLDIQPKMIAVPARELMPPNIKYGQKTIKARFGSWNMIDIKVTKPARLDGWACLKLIWKPGDITNAIDSIRPKLLEFKTGLNNLGLYVGAMTNAQAVALDINDYEALIDKVMAQVAKTSAIKLLLVVLPEKDNVKVYNAVKRACDVKYGVLNVCVKDQNLLTRSNAQYYANVGLKVNLKLGGKNHILGQNQLGIVGEGKTMVVGIDVTHPSPGSTSTAPSVAAVVASLDGDLAQWPAAIRVQESRQEMVEHLQSMFESRLQLWRAANSNALPENIIVYRDGVSEGMYQLVLDKELPALQKACQQIYPATDTKAKKPRISIIIVGKRHHTRFFATTAEHMDRSGNPCSGTVVDRGVTQAWLWDFFLQAHTALQGTARPGHYYVIYDEIFRARYANNSATSAADALEELTHSMCYLFGRATKAVSLCPPAYYADIACERARCYLDKEFESEGGPGGAVNQSMVEIHENVRNKMFYT